MAVPDTTTFTLQDVFTELGLSANGTNGLVQCFAAADPAQFDPAYEGSKNSLLNFRNYGAVPPSGKLIYMVGGFSSTPVEACGTIWSGPSQRWHDGIGSLPTIGDTIYTDEAMTTPMTGSSEYYVVSTTSAGTLKGAVAINSSGVVTSNIFLCA